MESMLWSAPACPVVARADGEKKKSPQTNIHRNFVEKVWIEEWFYVEDETGGDLRLPGQKQCERLALSIDVHRAKDATEFLQMYPSVLTKIESDNPFFAENAFLD